MHSRKSKIKEGWAKSESVFQVESNT